MCFASKCARFTELMSFRRIEAFGEVANGSAPSIQTKTPVNKGAKEGFKRFQIKFLNSFRFCAKVGLGKVGSANYANFR
jgi:hypothetical protein